MVWKVPNDVRTIKFAMHMFGLSLRRTQTRTPVTWIYLYIYHFSLSYQTSQKIFFSLSFVAQNLPRYLVGIKTNVIPYAIKALALEISPYMTFIVQEETKYTRTKIVNRGILWHFTATAVLFVHYFILQFNTFT